MTAADFAGAHSYRDRPLDRPFDLPPTILARLRERVADAPDEPYLTAVAVDGSTETLTYRELDTASAAVAGWVRDERGVAPGEVVGLLPTNEARSVVAIFALMRAGCPILMLNPGDPPERTKQQAEALSVGAILRGSEVPDLRDAEKWSDRDVDPTGDALYFGTSGSTASSKLVAQSHYSATVNAEAIRRHHRLRRGDRLLGCLPIHHVNGVHLTLFGTLAAGAHAILVHGFDPFGYPRLVETYAPRIASVVPSILEALTQTWRRPTVPAGFDYFVSAAAPLPAATARAVHDRLGVRVVQGYGLTETVNFATTMPPDLPASLYQRLMLDAEIPPIGVALFGNEVTVRAESGEPSAPGEIGEICVRGHNVMTRYAGNAEATAEAFRGGWFHTGDLGFLLTAEDWPDPFVVVTGRLKNIAKVRGESVSLDELDRVLRRVPSMRDAASAALPHRLLGDEVVAAVVCPPELTDADLLSHLRSTFPEAALPTRFVRLPAIPRTPTGKVLRPDLARQLAEPD